MNNPEITQINESENTEAIPLPQRNIFQAKLMKKMFGEDFSNKTRQERTDVEINWASKYAKLVSDIIDHKEYQEIRDLIMLGDYEKAIELIIPLINTSEDDEKAA